MPSRKSGNASLTGRPLPNTGNIYLTGLSGSGKSTVGPVLAEHLQWSFVDTDRLIEEATGMAVADIFSTFGESSFRDHETNMIEHVARMFRELVVSLGGGAIVSGKNRGLMHETGTIVYLKASPEILAERLADRSEVRPLLHVPGEDIAQRLRRLLEERRPLYEEAHVTIETGDLSADRIAQEILAKIA
jgi:shikimate kinase